MANFRTDREQPIAGEPEDHELEIRVRAALNSSPELQTHPIKITACRGVMELRGSVPSAELRHMAGQLAIAARGAREVANHIVVSGDRD